MLPPHPRSFGAGLGPSIGSVGKQACPIRGSSHGGLGFAVEVPDTSAVSDHRSASGRGTEATGKAEEHWDVLGIFISGTDLRVTEIVGFPYLPRFSPVLGTPPRQIHLHGRSG